MLQKLCELVGVSGYEEAVIEALQSAVQMCENIKVYQDDFGNLICKKSGKTGNQIVLVCAHVDEVGFQVIKRVSKNKYRLKPMGNIKCINAVGQTVVSSNLKGVICAHDPENIQPHNYENLYLKVKGSALPELGDVFTFAPNFREDLYYHGKALDNRVACYVLIRLIHLNIDTNADVIFAFSRQEEIGMRGVRILKSSLKPDIFIDVDTSSENEMNSIVVGNGVGIKLSDSLYVSDSQMVQTAKHCAEKAHIEYQFEISDCGTTELIISNENDCAYRELGISIPCKNAHTADMLVSKKDVESCYELLVAIIKDM